MKIQAAAYQKTLNDYVVETLADRLQRDSIEEDRIWGEMSDAAKKEGFASAEESEELLMRIRNA